MPILIKAVGMAAVVACCTGIGLELARTLSARVEALELALAVTSALAGEFSYSLTPPDEAVARLLLRPTLAKAEYLHTCAVLCKRGDPFPQAWRQATEQAEGGLTREDAEIIASLADVIGQMDIDGQLAGISHARELLRVQLTQARERVKTHGGLYRTLGTLAGVFLVILWF